MKEYSITKMVVTFGVFGIVFILPLILGDSNLNIAMEIFIIALFALSFNLLMGYGGMTSFGHAAFFGIGAYMFANLIIHISGMHLLLAVLLCGLAGMVAALIIGILCMHISGIYFALLTFAYQMMLYAVSIKSAGLTGAIDGMSIRRPDMYLPGFGNLSMYVTSNLYYFILIVMLICMAATYYFTKTSIGNAVIAIKENEQRASFLGYNVFYTKLIIFTLAGFMAGIAGGLYAFLNEFVSPGVIDMHMAFQVLLITLIGGSGSFFGPILGSVFYILFHDLVSSLTQHWMIIMGILFVIVVLYAKGGIIVIIQALWTRCERIVNQSSISRVRN